MIMNKQNGKLSLKMTLKKHIAHLRRRLKSYHNNIADNTTLGKYPKTRAFQRQLVYYFFG